MIDCTYSRYDDVIYAVKAAVQEMEIPERLVDMEVTSPCVFIRFSYPKRKDGTVAIASIRTSDLPSKKSCIAALVRKTILDLGGLCGSS